jgi:hypothetical protein
MLYAIRVVSTGQWHACVYSFGLSTTNLATVWVVQSCELVILLSNCLVGVPLRWAVLKLLVLGSLMPDVSLPTRLWQLRQLLVHSPVLG